MIKKVFQNSLLTILGVMLISCNAAETGFNAPDGSAIKFTTESMSASFPGAGELLVLATVQVSVPIGVGGTTESANQISGVISCAVCNLYVFKDGVSTYLPQISLLDPVAAGSFAFTTNQRGLYSFVFGIRSPIDLGYINSDGEQVGYTAQVEADIGVTNTNLEYTVSVPEE